MTRAEVIDQHVDVADEPTIGTILGNDFVYVANSAWSKFDDDGHRAGGAPLRAPILLALPLAPPLR